MSQKKYSLGTPMPTSATQGLSRGLAAALRKAFGAGRPAWLIRGPDEAVTMAEIQSWASMGVNCSDRFESGLYLVMFQATVSLSILAPDTLVFRTKLQLDGSDMLGDHPATLFDQQVDDLFHDVLAVSFWEVVAIPAGGHTLGVVAYWETVAGTGSITVNPNKAQLLVKQL